MVWKRRKPKWDWRGFLTEEERNVIRQADGAYIAWKRLSAEKAGIMNRAIHRAKYHALKKAKRS